MNNSLLEEKEMARPQTAWKVPSRLCVLRVTISLRILKPIAISIVKIEGGGAVSSDVQFLFLSSEKKCKLQCNVYSAVQYTFSVYNTQITYYVIAIKKHQIT